MEKIKIGIIGCGGIAKKIARTFQGMDTVEAYAVASRSLDKATAFAAQWNFTKAYGSYDEMLKDKEVELVYIATPHSEHYRHALLCLQYDKPVICEKPMTVNAKQAEELIIKLVNSLTNGNQSTSSPWASHNNSPNRCPMTRLSNNAFL